MKTDSTISLHHLPYLDRIRTLAMIMVIGVHSFGYAPQYTGPSYEITRFLINTVPVSLFFLVDGFLFAHKYTLSERFSYHEYLIKSFYRLVIPWLAFSILYASLRYAFEFHNFFDKNLLVGKPLFDQLIAIYASAIAPQTYFLLSLFLIRLFSPLLLRLLTLPKQTALIICVVYIGLYFFFFPILVEHNPIKIGQEPFIHAIWGTHFYLVGVIGFRLIPYFSKTLFYFLLFCFPVTLFLRYYFHTTTSINTLQYHYLFLLFLFFYFYSEKFHFLDVFRNCTMGIYLFHAPVLLKATSIIGERIIDEPGIRYFFIWTSSLLLAWLCTRILISTRYGCWLLGQKWTPANQIQLKPFLVPVRKN